MCGIAGIFVLGRRAGAAPVAATTLEAMVATLAHRGPDARGTATYGDAGLAHARLAILDLVPESNQPFEIDDGAYAITFNGEIFNYIELREELEALGHRFRTKSDTEVLLRAYATWGEDAVRRFNGMWAFAILDRRRDVLFCSRDRFGVKPFCYAEHGGRFLFGSEIKAILAAAPALARPDLASISMILRSGCGARQAHTCFDGVLRLPPAHSLTVSRDGLRLARYWDYPTEVEDVGPDEAAARFRDLLVDAIRLRMRSDVPVGTTLSGGVDSSSLVCLLRTFCDEPHETFTASYPGERHDESEVAERLSARLGMQSNLVRAGEGEFLPRLRRIVRHLEAPNQFPAVLPLWNIMALARTKVKVLLEGQGADELLAGYVLSCYPYALADLLRHGRVGRAAAELRWPARIYGAKGTALFMMRAMAPWGRAAFRRWRGEERVYAPPLRDAAPRPREREDAPPIADRLNANLRRQHEGTLVDLLHYGDAISMAHSIESRLPFLDYRLVELCFRLPGAYKLGDGWGKRLLRRAVEGLVPDEILAPRFKIGFATPHGRWFREHPETTVDPVLRSEACRARGLFDPAALDAALERHRAGAADYATNIYRWILTELWFQEFVDGGAAPAPERARADVSPLHA